MANRLPYYCTDVPSWHVLGKRAVTACTMASNCGFGICHTKRILYEWDWLASGCWLSRAGLEDRTN
jgi:hypothetical protein